jgi:hypothetical protein
LVMVCFGWSTKPFHTAPRAFHVKLFHVNGCGMDGAYTKTNPFPTRINFRPSHFFSQGDSVPSIPPTSLAIHSQNRFHRRHA